MKCDELEEEYLWTNNVKTPSTIMVRAYNADEVDAAIAELKQFAENACLERDDNQNAIDELQAENAELKARIQLDDDEMAGFLDLEEECGGGDLRNYIAELKQKLEDAGMRERRLRRALWLMTAEWAEGMGLASCNIAIKLSVKERFFYHDEANREKDIKKYRHRQVVFYKYADYCKKKAEAK